MEFKIVIDRKPPAIEDVKSFLYSNSSGAIVIFNGIVRNTNRGKEVIALEYDVDTETGKTVLKDYLKEMNEKIEKIYVFQAVGKLEVGKDTLIIGASSHSREDSFNAVSKILEFMKHNFPVWKKEYYRDQKSHWL